MSSRSHPHIAPFLQRFQQQNEEAHINDHNHTGNKMQPFRDHSATQYSHYILEKQGLYRLFAKLDIFPPDVSDHR